MAELPTNTAPAGTPASRGVAFEPVEGMARPLDRISFAYEDFRELAVTLHFKPVRGFEQPAELRVTFGDALIVFMEDEMWGLFDFPDDRPFTSFGTTFPALVFKGSPWLDRYCEIAAADHDRHAHFVFTSYSEILHVIGERAPNAAWLP